MLYLYSGVLFVVCDYQKLFKFDGIIDFDYGSIEGYVVVCVFVEGFKCVGCDLICEKFIGVLELMGNYDVGGFNVNFLFVNYVGFKFVEMIIINLNG